MINEGESIMNGLPFIHPIVDEWIIHGIGHCQPIREEENMLNDNRLIYMWIMI